MEHTDKGAVLITGASSGIGKACAGLFCKAGYRVFAGVRKDEDGESLRKEISSQLSYIILDICKSQDIADALDTLTRTLEPHEGLQGIINNAGIVVGGPLEFLSPDDFRYQIEVNLTGQLVVTQAFLPLIRRGHGRIIFVGSAEGRFAIPFSGAYAASKFGLEGLADALRRELEPWHIAVILVEPGTVNTPIWEKSLSAADRRVAAMSTDAKRLYNKRGDAIKRVMKNGLKNAVSAHDVAQLILTAMEREHPKARYQVGRDAYLAALSVFVPDRLKDWFMRNVIDEKLPSAMMGW